MGLKLRLQLVVELWLELEGFLERGGAGKIFGEFMVKSWGLELGLGEAGLVYGKARGELESLGGWGCGRKRYQN